MSSRFHCVSIHFSSSKACPAVERIAERRFLSMEAPRLPLDECSNIQDCRCRYQHHDDRRSQPRRDADVGLPTGSHASGERRRGRGRREEDLSPA